MFYLGLQLIGRDPHTLESNLLYSIYMKMLISSKNVFTEIL